MSPRTSDPLTLEFILLGLLDRQPMHGYDLHRALSEPVGVGMLWHVKQGRMYALLDKLEGEGYLEHQVELQAQLPPRKVFSLTALGKQALTQWVESPVAHPREMRQDFLARLYFARQNGAEREAALVRKQKAACQAWKIKLQAQLARQDEALSFSRSVYLFRLHQVEGMLAWLDTLAMEPTP